MFYFIHGTDVAKSLEKAKSLVDSLQKKKPNASLFKLTTDNWSRGTLEELLFGQALFENKYIVYISRILDNAESSGDILDFLKEMKDSDNIFIWLENEVTSKDLKQIEKYAEKVQFYEEKEKFKKPEFNIFSLTDAIGNRDKKRLWLLFQEAKEHFVTEEIYGTMFWQVKSMLIVSKVKNASETDMKPFVFNKAKSFNKNYSNDELESITRKMLEIYHDARRGLCDFDMALERFCLEI